MKYYDRSHTDTLCDYIVSDRQTDRDTDLFLVRGEVTLQFHLRPEAFLAEQTPVRLRDTQMMHLKYSHQKYFRHIQCFLKCLIFLHVLLLVRLDQNSP